MMMELKKSFNGKERFSFSSKEIQVWIIMMELTRLSNLCQRSAVRVKLRKNYILKIVIC